MNHKRLHRQRKRFGSDTILLASLLSLMTVGCSQDQSPDVIQTRTVSTQPNDPSPDIKPQQVATESVLGTGVQPPDFPADANFFAVPAAAPAQVEIARSSTSEQVTIRLIGFINSAPANQQQRSALLKFGKRLVHLREGESYDDTKLLSIDDRTVTLQRKRDRWTLAMMDQPIVNRAASPSSLSRNHSRKRPTLSASLTGTAHPGDTPLVQPWTPDAPVLPVSDDQPSGLNVEQPEALPMPELPDINGLPGL